MRLPRTSWGGCGWRPTLRQKLSFWSFVPSVAILIVALLAYGGYQQATTDLAVERNRDLTRLVAEQLAVELQESVHILDVLTRDPELQSGDLSRQLTCLQQAKGRLTIFDAGVMILTAEGRIVAGQPIPTSWMGRDMSTASWYNDRSARFSNIVLEGPTGEPGTILTVPIHNAQDERIGLLAGAFNVPPGSASTLYGGIRRGVGRRGLPNEDILYVDDKGQLHPAREVSALARLFQHTRDVSLGDSEDDTFYIVDSTGRTLYHPERDLIGQDISPGPVVAQALLGHVGAARTRSAQGRLVVASYAPIEGTPWMLVTEEPWDALMAYSLESRSLILLLLALGVLLPAIVVTLAVRRITDPLRQMIVAAQEVASGHFGHTIQAKTGDEIEDLAGQFNTMSTQLEASYADLERRVRDRTRELQTLTAVAVETSQLLDLHAVMAVALERTLSALDLQAGEALCSGADGEEPALLATYGFQTPELASLQRPPLWSSLAVAQEVSQLSVGACGLPPSLVEALARQGITQIIRVPILTKTECVGALHLAAQRPQYLEAEALALLSSIGRQVGVAAENVRLHTKAQQLAIVEERNRLARELHDSVTQSLYAITFYAEAAARLIDRSQPDLASRHVTDLGQTAQSALQEMRLLVFDLRPPVLEEEGLVAALRARLDAVEGRAGLSTHLEILGTPPMRDSDDETLYRIAQEALNNVLKHAQASTIAVSLDYQHDGLVMEITDDGVGFDPQRDVSSGHLGLQSMRERAQQIGANLTITSRGQQGTTVRVEV